MAPEDMNNTPEIDLLRLVTAGSVDDGKSTLIGRLLYDTGNVFEDQVAAIERADRVEGELDFSLLTDGLLAEREQKITIDVAYRYFSTDKRRFIIADVPGHEQYTRNMVTGASHAQVALILIDARHGLLEQSRRHIFLASLLNIPHVAIVVNKMDMVGYDEEVFKKIRTEFNTFAGKLNITDVQFIPTSGLKGDMVVHRGEHMPWYNGRTVLDYLEHIQTSSDRNLIDLRFPVQYVLRPHQDFRGYAGQLASGIVRVGDEIMALPSMKTTTVKSILVNGESREYAFHPESIVLTCDDEIDISRGDMIVRVNNTPEVTNAFEAMVFWMNDTELEEGKTYLVKQTTRTVRASVAELRYGVDVSTLHRQQETTSLAINDIGKIGFRTNEPLMFDLYEKNRQTGNFIIIDEMTGQTAGAGIITKAKKGSSMVHTTQEQEAAPVLWFTGLSGSGKTTIATCVEALLKEQGVVCEYLDGDVLRSFATRHLGFSKEDRLANTDVAGFLAERLSAHGAVVLASFISPYKEQRDALRERVSNFIEIYVDTPIEVCEKRDVKGLYAKARAGELQNFTGIDDPYEAPENPELVLEAYTYTVDECAQMVIRYLQDHRLI